MLKLTSATRGSGMDEPTASNSRARVTYTRELAELPATYKSAQATDVTKLREAMLELGGGPARMVGTGGTMALAQLARYLHETLSRQPGRALTPLEILTAPPLQRAGAILFSARARHPDARLVLDHLSSDAYSPTVLVTHREAGDLQDHLDRGLTVVRMPPPALGEGFLATNSVMAMAVGLIRAALGEVLSPRLVDAAEQLAAGFELRERLLLLFAPSLAPAATDLETRCAELGLAPVQLADLRNVAHGRHTGLARNAEHTTVLVLSDTASRDLADAVARPLEGSGAAIVRWHADRPWPEALIVLLAASMHLVQRMGAGQGLDPARPGVPSFGRQLYHLPLRRLLASPPAGPVAKKLAAIGAGETVPVDIRQRYEAAHRSWASELRRTPLGGIAFDYDGTVCATSRRYSLPTERLQASFVHLLDGGLRIGFASGRGKSLHADLRRWVPRRHWPDILVGLYNGAVRYTLADELPDLTAPGLLMALAARRLEASPFAELMSIETRSAQVTVSAARDSLFHGGRLAALVRELVRQPPALGVKVVASGHSVDVVAAETTKLAVLEEIAGSTDAAVLAVGDQGDAEGNDFELLAATRWSVSLDRCSADPSRCWPIDPAGRRGPAALAPMLEAIDMRLEGAILDVDKIRKRGVRSAREPG